MPQRQKHGINANVNLTFQTDIQRVLKYLENINYYALCYLMAPTYVANHLAVDADIKEK